MSPDEFRRLCRARPFVPFTAVLADGREISVWDQEFVMVSPDGRTANVYQYNGALDLIDLQLVIDLRVPPQTEAASQGP